MNYHLVSFGLRVILTLPHAELSSQLWLPTFGAFLFPFSRRARFQFRHQNHSAVDELLVAALVAQPLELDYVFRF